MSDPKVCKECPWRKSVIPGALGGSPVETYLGQVHGQYVLACHMHCDFSDPQWREKTLTGVQCAGAAQFRYKSGLVFPAALLVLPYTEDVFASPAEFMAHHKQIPIEAAEKYLAIIPVSKMLEHQLRRVTNITLTAPADEPLDPRFRRK